MAADAHHRAHVVTGHTEVGRRQLGTLDEQAHRVVPHRLVDRGVLVGQRQRRHPIERLPGNTEPFPAGGQHAKVRARRQQVPTESGRWADDLFTVVEDEQDTLGADVLGHRPNQRRSGDAGHSEALCELVDQHVSIANGTEFGHSQTIGKLTEKLFGDPHRQPRLACSPGSGQRDQAVLVEQIQDLAQFVGPTDEARQLRRQVIVGAFHRAQTWELSDERWVTDLVDSFRFSQPAEAVSAQVDDFDLRWKSSPQQIDRGLREHELVAVGRRRQPSTAVDGGAEIVTVANRRRTGVQADTHLEGEAGSWFHERELDVERCLDSLGSRLESRREAVTSGAEDVAMVPIDDRADSPIVFGQRFGHRFGDLIPERGRSFDVGEQECDIARRRELW